MKKIFLLSTITTAVLLSGCDNIDIEDRYINVQPDVNKSEKVVLLEDYTGMQCSNCPDAAKIIENIHNIYGDQFIAVSLHPASGPYQKPMPDINGNMIDLGSETAKAYYEKFSVKSFPTAMIDRATFDDTNIFDNKDKWSGYVIERMKEVSPVNISMTSTYDSESREFTIDTDVAFSDNFNEELKLQLWVIENGIIAPQITSTGKIQEYEHNHVLRDAVNGTWGESLGTSFEKNQKLKKSNSYTLSTEWIDSNCQVVGFIYSSDEILQAHIVNLVSEVGEKRQEKTVLLEDYTGMQYSNCPDAAKIVDNIHSVYGDNFIAVSLHPASGPYQKPMPDINGNMIDLGSETAKAYYDKYSVKSFPTAMIDRATFDGTNIFDNKDKWSGYVIARAEITTPVGISLTADYNNESRQITVNSDITFYESVADELTLQLWVIENGIIAPQITSKGMEKEYVHNHVLRDAINGTWGESIGTYFEPQQRVTTYNTYNLSPDWIDNNCQIVGFIYSNNTGEIMQAHIVDLIK